MIKKLLLTALAILMLTGCKKSETKIDPSPSPSSAVTSATETDEPTASAEATSTPQVSKAPLEPPKVDTATKDPKRTPNIPETPPSDKVVTTVDKNAGSGVNAENVPDTAVSATSEENAIILAKQYMKANNIYIPSNVELIREDNEYYYLHAYEILTMDGKENKSSVGWFNVNKQTSKVTKGDADIKVGERPETSEQ